MILYIALLLLFLLVLALSVAEHCAMRKKIKLRQSRMQELNLLVTQLNRNIEKLNNEMSLQMLQTNTISESLNMTLMEQFAKYQKSGGTDDYPTWIVKSDSQNLFP